MRPYEDDDESTETPAQVWMQLQRQKQAERNFVAPPAPLAVRQPVTIDAPAWLATSQPVDVANVWQAPDGAMEKTSAMDRARALRVRLLPFVLLWALLAVIVFVVVLFVASNAPGAALVGLLAFVAMTSGTYIKLNGQDYAHSREGTERHRIDSATFLAERQLDHEAELRRMALEAWLKRMGDQ